MTDKRYRKRGKRGSGITRKMKRLSASAPEFVPSWLTRSIRSSQKVVSNGINSLLREINTRRRRSLGEKPKSH